MFVITDIETVEAVRYASYVCATVCLCLLILRQWRIAVRQWKLLLSVHLKRPEASVQSCALSSISCSDSLCCSVFECLAADRASMFGYA